MLDVILRVYGEEFDMASFLSQHQNLIVADSFNKGEHDMFGNPNPFSGFDVIVAESETAENCIQRIQQFLEMKQQALNFLKANEVTCVLDIDVTIGSVDEMPTPLNLSPQLLGDLHQLNIAIEFSAYPHTKGV